MTRREIEETTAKLCGALTELGFEYHTEADNRSNRRSHYIYARRPIYMEIRVSDHPPGKVQRRKRFDIGPHGISVEQAIEEITALARRGKK